MRTVALIVAAGILLVFVSPFAAPAAAQTPGIAKLSVTLYGETDGGEFVFREGSSGENRILLPYVPIILNVTFHNNETSVGIVHTFTINDDAGDARIDSGNVDANGTVQLEFIVEALDEIRIGNETFAPESEGSGILFYCTPHRNAGMIGTIVLATAEEAAGEKGILLRAYWIGIIGIVAMLVWIGITYFVIKSSSPLFTDHREHLRKGLP